MSLTTNPNDPRLQNQSEKGQNDTYLVLPDEELAKGFVRPYRDKYIHVGRHYKNGVEMLEKHEPGLVTGKIYVAIANVFMNGERIGGTYITQEELDQFNNTGGYIGGCGVETVMGQKLSETYARNPKFYGATFCVGCNKHLPVGEFRWSKDGTVVGS
jgi:hypothetical protein